MRFAPTAASAVAGTLSVVSAAAGDKILVWVGILINAAILISNAAFDIYRKWRNRDKDLEGGSDEKNENKKGD